MKALNYIALIILIVAALNWGLIGLFSFDLIGAIFGGMTSAMSRIIFVIAGIAGLWGLSFFGKLGQTEDNQ